MLNLYSDGFIAENAFSDQANSFSLQPQELEPRSIAERAESKRVSASDFPIFDPKEIKSKMKHTLDLHIEGSVPDDEMPAEKF